jgi:hypothetical protein
LKIVHSNEYMRSQFYLLILFFSFITAQSFAETKRFKSVRLEADTTRLWFLHGKLPIGCEVTHTSGKVRRSTGYFNGNMNWDNFIISSDQGKNEKGIFVVDIAKVLANNRVLEITVTLWRDETIKQKIKLFMPELEAIQLHIPANLRLIPGSSFSPEIETFYTNGARYRSNPWMKGALIPTSDFILYQDQTEVANGEIRLPNTLADLRDEVTISVIWKAKKSIYDVKVFAIDFEYTTEVNIIPPSIPKGKFGAGGSTNSNGENGQSGASGIDAPDVTLYMWMDEDSTKEIIHIKVHSAWLTRDLDLKAGRSKFNLVVPGGNGGSGGDGGDGGNAEDGTGQEGGIGGNGGNGGDGGRGAKVIIWCDAASENYLSQINIDNRGGSGGNGGSGGKGGRMSDDDGHTSLFDVLFPSRNSNGNYGNPGRPGLIGPEADITVRSADEIKTMANKIH